MNINIKQKSPVYAGRVYKDGLELRCQHLKAEVEMPCCNGDDCGCRGTYLVYCPDCNGADLSEEQIDRMIMDYVYACD